jgi:hypothetical protein
VWRSEQVILSNGRGCAVVLPVHCLPKPSVHNEIVEHDLTRGSAEPEQPRCLVHVEAQSRHFAIRAENHRNKTDAGWFGAGFATNMSSTVGSEA